MAPGVVVDSPAATVSRTAGEAVGYALADLGVDTVFGLIGTSNFVVTDALRARGVTFHSARHECQAVCMANGWGRVTRRVGVASLHAGAGLTHSVSGIAEAVKSRTPMLILVGEVPPSLPDAASAIDQEQLITSVGAISERLRSPETAVADVLRAMARARLEQLPVVLNLPVDIQRQPVDLPRAAAQLPVAMPAAPSAHSIRAIADLITGARRPVILAGRGAVLADADVSLRRLGDRAGALLANTLLANGVFSGERFAVGTSGGFSSPMAAELLGEADLVLAFGASLTDWTTRAGFIFGTAKVVQIDVDPRAFGRFAQPVDLRVLGDASLVAQLVEEDLASRGFFSEGYRQAATATAIAERRWVDEPFDDVSGDGLIDPRALTKRLSEILPAERTITGDAGLNVAYWTRVSPPDADGWLAPITSLCVGLGLGSAIGAAVARPDRLTVTTIGDGGMLMAAGELETAVRVGHPMLIVIYNDSAYGAEVVAFGPAGYDMASVQFPDFDFAALARAAGAQGATATSLSDLAELEEWLAAPSGVFVLDAKVSNAVPVDGDERDREWQSRVYKSQALH